MYVCFIMMCIYCMCCPYGIINNDNSGLMCTAAKPLVSWQGVPVLTGVVTRHSFSSQKASFVGFLTFEYFKIFVNLFTHSILSCLLRVLVVAGILRALLSCCCTLWRQVWYFRRLNLPSEIEASVLTAKALNYQALVGCFVTRICMSVNWVLETVSVFSRASCMHITQ